jgi:hypothetical protein
LTRTISIFNEFGLVFGNLANLEFGGAKAIFMMSARPVMSFLERRARGISSVLAFVAGIPWL